MIFFPKHYYRLHLKDGEGTVFSLFVSSHLNGEGGYPIQPWTGGVPNPSLDKGVPHLRSRSGGSWSQVWGVLVSGLGGYLVSGPGGYLVSVKGKIFDTRFGLIHVQTGKIFFVEGPPPVKGKFLTPDLA